ncbi:unnamed protein product [Nezara viridula]|uniref:Uncharacterized protein n=1 Tax=Nezara viridula TaxID=85310 RepID=A0A9P0H9W4_NEZVI|nr:unnamed protein product [Nezara viridula]
MNDFLEDLDNLIETIDPTPSKSFREKEKRKKDFREYLHRSGVYQSLSKALKVLCEQPTKPKNPIDFICSNIGQPRASEAEFKKMSDELQAKYKIIKKLEEELASYGNPQPICDEAREDRASERSQQ